MSWLVYPTLVLAWRPETLLVCTVKNRFLGLVTHLQRQKGTDSVVVIINGDFVSIKMTGIKKNGRNGEIVG